jgi:hypothetical protein
MTLEFVWTNWRAASFCLVRPEVELKKKTYEITISNTCWSWWPWVSLPLLLRFEREATMHVSLEEEVVHNDYLWAVLPPKHPLAKEKKIKLEKLASEPFVLFHRVGAPSLFDEAVAMCRRAGFSPKVRHEPDLMTTVFVLVLWMWTKLFGNWLNPERHRDRFGA